jgi:hypothetical protein
MVYRRVNRDIVAPLSIYIIALCDLTRTPRPEWFKRPAKSPDGSAQRGGAAAAGPARARRQSPTAVAGPVHKKQRTVGEIQQPLTAAVADGAVVGGAAVGGGAAVVGGAAVDRARRNRPRVDYTESGGSDDDDDHDVGMGQDDDSDDEICMVEDDDTDDDVSMGTSSL